MRTLIATALLASIAIAPAIAQTATTTTATASVVERDARGRATRVSVEGRTYEVCRQGLTDGCINPREAGLNFGNVPLDHWPGRPASETRRSGAANPAG
ncbi:hypothetical protein [Alteraurantiacibacter buctensis]|uniref:Uncharacterized protein n=1 Tax=Alteraurantiacibacter buctensis TaxID=1503981 RepID=A0A844YYE7_9SPHN|nr:hypothetical protein [Alteraurantiacibacter buctensis]MXO71494.1 hypothetical protein [Alteraurantiacibacter buctensis]